MTQERDDKKGLSKAQLIEHFKNKLREAASNKSELWTELYDTEDLTLVTENHASVIPMKLRLKMVMHAIDPKRTKPLAQLWLSDFNSEMVSFKRQGRLEGLGALQALETMEEEKAAKI